MLMYKVNLQNHTFKWSFEFMEGRSSLNIITLPGLVAIDIVVVEIMFLIYHMESRNHVLKALSSFVC